MICPMITIYWKNFLMIMKYWTNCPMITIYRTNCPMMGTLWKSIDIFFLHFLHSLHFGLSQDSCTLRKKFRQNFGSWNALALSPAVVRQATLPCHSLQEHARQGRGRAHKQLHKSTEQTLKVMTKIPTEMSCHKSW